MKRHLIAAFVGLFLFQGVAQAQQRLKIATVSMERLFNEFKETADVQKEINIERARIQKENNVQLAAIREIDDQLQKIREENEANPEMGQKKTSEMYKKSEELSQDGIHRERTRTEYLERRNGSLNEKMKNQMRAILVKIQRAVSDRAKSGNYDYIFDSSGNSNQGIPFVLHSRDTTDLTESLLKELNGE